MSGPKGLMKKEEDRERIEHQNRKPANAIAKKTQQ